jgi:site-specific DNA-methyltransferase (adenine-specific)
MTADNSPYVKPPAPYYDDGFAVIYHGDTLDVLAGLIGETVDSVVTDPPYASGARTEAAKSDSGAMLRGVRWAAQPIENDQMTTTGFVWLLRQVGMAVRPMLPDGGSLLSFIDWRQWPHLVGALETCNYRVQGMIVWDKGSYGLGNGFRAQHELICHAAKGVPTIYDKSCGNVLRSTRQEPVDHPSPKPQALMARLIEVVTPPGGVVLDPFMGAGTTVRAALDIGRRAVGIEVVEKYCEIAAKRLAQGVLAL